jgi:hypothetical protein
VHQTMALSHSTRPSDPHWSEHQSHVSTQRSEVSLSKGSHDNFARLNEQVNPLYLLCSATPSVVYS